MEDDRDPLAPQVRCPRCGKMTDRIQVFDVPVIAFLFVGAVWKDERIWGCTKCVQSAMWKRLFLSIPMANIICAFPVAWIMNLLIRSAKKDRPGIPPEYAYLIVSTASPPDPVSWQGTSQGKWKRLLIVLLILAAVVAFVVFVLPRLTEP